MSSRTRTGERDPGRRAAPLLGGAPAPPWGRGGTVPVPRRQARLACYESLHRFAARSRGKRWLSFTALARQPGAGQSSTVAQRTLRASYFSAPASHEMRPHLQYQFVRHIPKWDRMRDDDGRMAPYYGGCSLGGVMRRVRADAWSNVPGRGAAAVLLPARWRSARPSPRSGASILLVGLRLARAAPAAPARPRAASCAGPCPPLRERAC